MRTAYLFAREEGKDKPRFADDYVAIPFNETDMSFPFDIVFRADSHNPALLPLVEALTAAIQTDPGAIYRTS